MKGRILTVALATLLALLGAAGVLAYVHRADARAVAGMKAVTVLVAQREIPSGTPASAALRDGLLRSQRLPASAVPADAVASIGPDLGTLVTSANVQPGELLLRPMLVTAADVTDGVAIPKGMVAVTIALCLPEAVAGYIHPGAQVAVFDTFSHRNLNVQESCGTSHQAQVSGTVQTRIVLPRVEILSVGPAPSSGQNSSSASTTAAAGGQTGSAAAQAQVLVTVAVSQADAERLILLNEAGLPYLALLSSSSQTKFDTTFYPLFQR